MGRFEYIAGLRDPIPSRREADDTDLAGVDLELTGARAHQAYRTLGVLQRKEVLGRHCTMAAFIRSEEHTSELQSLMRISYAVFCLKKNTHSHLIYRTEANNSNMNITPIPLH